VVGLAGKLRLRAVPGLDGGTPEGRGHSVWTGAPPQDGRPCPIESTPADFLAERRGSMTIWR
jgi:hypothetical protein